jgi:hypothetical protein
MGGAAAAGYADAAVFPLVFAFASLLVFAMAAGWQPPPHLCAAPEGRGVLSYRDNARRMSCPGCAAARRHYRVRRALAIVMGACFGILFVVVVAIAG